ncbi:MAG: hypothetical protein HZA36_03705 [Parcubacteria group bacterium]|nr:hypothetical protein [Parcubacteria group bacterium]
MQDLEHRIKKIEERNARVELDKKWETSWVRRILLAVFTYLAIGFYLYAIEIPRPWINAIVPTLGFIISTLTMPLFKRIWFTYAWKRRRIYDCFNALDENDCGRTKNNTT